MNPSRLFIERPVATALLMLAILLAGLMAYRLLPLSALPEVDYPTISVTTLYPGASPDVISTTVTAPLERQFGQMPGLSQMTSSSSGGASVITLRFSLGLSLDVAEQEVQAAINAGGNLLPADLPMPPIYSKVNPADAPVLTIAITSPSLPIINVHDLTENRLAPKLSQVEGVGLVSIAGGRRPAVRIQANPTALASLGLSLDDVRSAIASANVNQAKGSFDGSQRASTIDANDQLRSVAEYQNLIVAWKNGNPLRLKDVAEIVNDAENLRLAAWADRTPGIILNVQRQPGANVIQTVDRVKALLPKLQATLPASIDVQVIADRTTTIRASVDDTGFELLLSVVLVVMVIFLFLRSASATLIPAAAVPLSLIGTFGVMYLAGFSINNLTLMALTISTGFVVDDAIVMIENIARYVEEGETPMAAALKGSKQIGFTIISLTVSLIAVLIPLLFMGDVVGRLFHEFAITLAVSILISAFVSLTLTPMMSGRLLRAEKSQKHGRIATWSAQAFDRSVAQYGRMLDWVLDRPVATLLVFALTLALTAVLYVVVPKGFFPTQDTGLIQVITEATQTTSFDSMSERQQALADVILKDPSVDHLSSFIGVDGANPTLNTGRMQITLKPFAQRTDSASAIIRRLADSTSRLPGITAYMQPVQDLTIEDRVSKTQYQFLLSSPDATELATATSRLLERLKTLPQLVDVATDLQDQGLQAFVQIDREAAGRLGVTVAAIDTALYNAFGQRLISTVYTQSSQYRVVLEVAPQFKIGPRSLENLYVPGNKLGSTGVSGVVQIPLSSLAQIVEKPAALSINHVAQFPAATVSFNLQPNVSLGEAVDAIRAEEAKVDMPASVETSFQGAAEAFRASLTSTLLLIVAAVVTMYIVLGVLYESYIHPVTILSTLPSAGLGALLALLISGQDLGIVAIIGIVLLIGIVKKNAIMMIDFALDAEREQGLEPRAAIHQASLLRFRPILMTTMAALLGALPLMLGTGAGHELRHPLGVTMVGGLIVSQLLTLFTTPVIYLGFARQALKMKAWRERRARERAAREAADDAAAVPAAESPPWNISAPFIARPVATTLMTIGLALAGALCFQLLPIAPLPQVDFPTISVSASLPGASPDTMAATVATPLERALGAIAGITQITSRSSLGSSNIILQFDLSRDINGAARDVQAAINASRTLLPTGLPSNPSYRKVNPADAPIMILSLTSSTLTRGQMYDAASTVLAQRLSQVEGVGQVGVSGGALPAVRVELNPDKLAANGIALDTVRTAITSTNANRPKGSLEESGRYWQIGANDQARVAAEYGSIMLTYRNGAAVRLRDVADVLDSVQDTRNYGAANGKPAILLFVQKEPGANIIETVERVRALLPRLKSSIPQAIDLDVISDRTPTIRASLREVERAMAIAVGLVILVVLLFLRSWRATLIPAVAVPVSLAGTFGVMYLCGYSLDNLSAMALTVATGFVVDDAIVVLENITRYIEKGLKPLEAAREGAREIGFTVVSISLSLVAVFIPILMMGGVVGRLFREFAVVLSAAILVSMVVSLTTTPMMAARLLKQREHKRNPGRFARASSRVHQAVVRGYRRSLIWTLRHQPVALLSLVAVVALNVHLYTIIPKTFFPQQDTGVIVGGVQADQGSSFQMMRQRLDKFMGILNADPAVANVNGFTGGGQRNSANFFVTLKPLAERKVSADAVVARLRDKLAHEPGANLFLVPVQDIRIGGRQANAQYQYTLQADELEDLRTWEPRVRNALSLLPELTDVNTDQQDKGLQTSLVIDRDAAARLGVTVSTIDTTLNNAFGQRQVGVIYNPLNQYRVVMELAPEFLQGPETLKRLYVTNNAAEQVPLSAIARVETTNTPLAVSHQSGTPASTISFNLPLGVSLSQATAAIDSAMAELGVPVSVRGSFQGTANAFQQSLSSQPLLIAAAIITIYLVLGMLYESLVHPITILSTLPSAGVGALLALMLFNTEFSIIALIGVILLIGIVKKNAIMMIDFAIARQRAGHVSAATAIYRAANLRVRPILMTTMAAIFGAVPLALGSGDGAELRQPLGIAIVGGLILSQLLTLYTTPVVFVCMDRLRWRNKAEVAVLRPAAA